MSQSAHGNFPGHRYRFIQACEVSGKAFQVLLGKKITCCPGRATGGVSLHTAVYKDEAWNSWSQSAATPKIQQPTKKAGNCSALIKPYLISIASPDHFSYMGQYGCLDFWAGSELGFLSVTVKSIRVLPDPTPTTGWERGFLQTLAALISLHQVSMCPS